MNTVFRIPADAKDAKKQLRKIERSIKKAQAERADAERSLYDIGVRVADDRIAELEAARAHFQKYV